MKKREIEFYLFIPPTKNSIYPEFLPTAFKPKTISKLSQIIDYLKTNTDIKIVDTRNELLNGKKFGQLYYKSDTHWNNKGAYIGYRKLISEIKKDYPNIKPITMKNLYFKNVASIDGDLGSLLVLNDNWNIQHYEYRLRNNFHAVPLSNRELNEFPLFKELQPRIFRHEIDSLPKLLMYRDSYTIALTPLLSEHFSKSTYLWTYTMRAEEIDQVKPDIVVMEILERFLDELVAANPQNINSN